MVRSFPSSPALSWCSPPSRRATAVILAACSTFSMFQYASSSVAPHRHHAMVCHQDGIPLPDQWLQRPRNLSGRWRGIFCKRDCAEPDDNLRKDGPVKRDARGGEAGCRHRMRMHNGTDIWAPSVDKEVHSDFRRGSHPAGQRSPVQPDFNDIRCRDGVALGTPVRVVRMRVPLRRALTLPSVAATKPFSASRWQIPTICAMSS